MMRLRQSMPAVIECSLASEHLIQAMLQTGLGVYRGNATEGIGVVGMR